MDPIESIGLGLAHPMERSRVNPIRFYYYLVPLWFVLEDFYWPGLRAGLVAGNSSVLKAAFYGIEAGIGAMFWFGVRGAGALAFLENMAYLIFAIKFILLSPIRFAENVESGSAEAVRTYIDSLPGIFGSMGMAVVQYYRQGWGDLLSYAKDRR